MSVKKVVKKSTRASAKPVVAQDFSNLLRDGLSSHKSYVVLKQKHRSPIYLAFKPFISRVGKLAVYIGGKLSAFPNTGHEAWAGIDYEGKLEVLKKAFKSLPKDRVGTERIGSNAGVFVSAGQGDLVKLQDKIDVKKIVKSLLDGIEEELDIEIENRIDVTKYLVLTFTKRLNLGDGFYTNGESLASRQIGKISVVQFGQSKASTYGNQALSDFIAKNHLQVIPQDEAA